MNPFASFNSSDKKVSSKHTPSEVLLKPVPLKNVWAKYALTVIFVNAAIWATALFYVVKAKTAYVSEWSLNIANSGGSSNINLPNIGQAVSQETSAYSGTTYDPRENYKTIASSEEVLKAAARALNMSVVKFGKPRIKIVENTTLMQFSMQGASPEEAQKKSTALYNTLEIKLNQLRKEEISQQNTRLQRGIDDLRRKLKVSQERLSNYRAKSGVSSDEQIRNLAVNIETLRKQRAETIAKAQDRKARLVELSGNLGLSSQDASDVFSLQADTLFQKYLLAYNDAKSKLITLNAKFLPTHPVSLTQKAEVATSQEALLSRARIVLKRPLSLTDVDRLTFGNADTSGSKRTTFSEQLVSAAVESQGLEAEVRTLDREITALERRLKVLSARQATIEDLNREVEVAEAVFSSTIARLDLAKSSISNSYPPIQILGEPSKPEKPAEPTKETVLLGTLVCSIFLSSGIITMGRREQRSFAYYSHKER